nr:TOBE domain-containing protein [Oceanicella sp. SM1341]
MQVGERPEATYLGTTIRYRLETEGMAQGQPLLMRLDARGQSGRPAVGERLTIGWRPVDGHLLAAAGGVQP